MLSADKNGKNGHGSSSRLTGYLADWEKLWWAQELQRVRKLEGLRNLSMGDLFGRIVRYGMRLDNISMRKYSEILTDMQHPRNSKASKAKLKPHGRMREPIPARA